MRTALLVLILILFCCDLKSQWTILDNKWQNLSFCEYEILNDSTYFISSHFSNTLDGLWVSSNGGETWKNILNKSSQHGFFEIVNEEIYYLARNEFGPTVYYSSDLGDSWQDMNSGGFYEGFGSSRTAFFAVDTCLFTGSVHGYIYKSIDKGKTWFNSSNGINLNEPYGNSINCFCYFHEVIYCGTEKGIFISEDLGLSWRESDAGLNLPQKRNIIEIESSNTGVFALDYFNGAYYSTNAYDWTALEINSFDNDKELKHFETIQVSGDHVYVEYNFFSEDESGMRTKSLLSTDNGHNWSFIDVFNESELYRNVSEMYGDLLFHGAADYGLKSDGGLKKYNIEDHSTDQIDYSINMSNTQSIFAMDSVILASTLSGGTYRSVDFGHSFETVLNNLSGIKINDFAAIEESIFAATEEGLFLSFDYGLKWSVADTNLLNTNITCLDTINQTLIIGTENGVFNKDFEHNITSHNLADRDILCSESNDSKHLLGTDNGIYHFDNSIWTALPDHYDSMVVQSIACSEEDFYFISDGNIYQVTEYGGSFFELAKHPLMRDELSIIEYVDDRLILATEIGVWVYLTGYDSWVWSYRYSSAQSIHIQDSYIYCGTSDGVYKSNIDDLPNGIIKMTVSETPFISYPNPLSDKLHIEYKDNTIDKVGIQLFDIKGNMVMQSLHFNENPIVIDLSNLENNIYIIRYTIDEGVYLDKLLKL